MTPLEKNLAALIHYCQETWLSIRISDKEVTPCIREKYSLPQNYIKEEGIIRTRYKAMNTKRNMEEEKRGKQALMNERL